MTVIEEAERALTEAVNYCRYRGVEGKDPMTNGYRWPLRWDEEERITKAALKLVLAKELAKAVAEVCLKPGGG